MSKVDLRVWDGSVASEDNQTGYTDATTNQPRHLSAEALASQNQHDELDNADDIAQPKRPLRIERQNCPSSLAPLTMRTGQLTQNRNRIASNRHSLEPPRRRLRIRQSKQVLRHHCGSQLGPHRQESAPIPTALLLLNENTTVCTAKTVGKKYRGRGYDCSR